MRKWPRQGRTLKCVLRAFGVIVSHRRNWKSGVKATSVQMSGFALFKIKILLMGTPFWEENCGNRDTCRTFRIAFLSTRYWTHPKISCVPECCWLKQIVVVTNLNILYVWGKIGKDTAYKFIKSGSISLNYVNTLVFLLFSFCNIFWFSWIETRPTRSSSASNMMPATRRFVASGDIWNEERLETFP